MPGLTNNVTLPVTCLNEHRAALFTTCTESPPRKASLNVNINANICPAFAACAAGGGGLAVAILAPLACCHPPPVIMQGASEFPQITAGQNRTAKEKRDGVTRFVCARVPVRMGAVRGPYLGMENRDAASFFLIFLHSVGHLGGGVR